MKICLVSFDYWNYDHHIVSALQKKGIEAYHIDISKFKYEYSSIFEHISNFLSKLIFNKNIKKIKRQEFIIDELSKIGKQDAILTIRPDLINIETHKKIKSFTDKYIAYIYDSCKRFPIDHLLNGIFDRIYSFDLEDVSSFGFEHITNFIYLDKQDIKSDYKYEVFIVLTPDKRIDQLNKIAEQLKAFNISFKFIAVSNKKPDNLHPSIEYRKHEIKTKELKTYLDDSRIILDLLRENHNGISFRVFEALAYQKKIITNNASIKKYAFYNHNNIMVIDPKDIKIDFSFFESNYQPLDESIYHQFTVDHFADVVFDLKN